MEPLSQANVNEIERRILCAEKNRGTVTLDWRLARGLLSAATGDDVAGLGERISNIEEKVRDAQFSALEKSEQCELASIRRDYSARRAALREKK